MLSINTNLSSMIAQNSMKTSTAKLDQAIERMTTGAKLNHAKDNAANYSIATNMTTKMGALRVAEDNILQGLDLINICNSSLELISDKLMRLKNISLQAHNDAYSGASLQALEAEAKTNIEEINRIFTSTNYNGVKLFEEQKIRLFQQEITQIDTSSLTTLKSVDENADLADGTYSISTPEELLKLANMTNAGKISSGDKFVLAKDIDLKKYSTNEGWTPIGNSTNTFKGSFDGNGYVIKNLYINRSTINYQGLFGYSVGSIKNLGIENIEITGKICVGGIAGKMSSSITNCYVIGNITGEQYVGGLAGEGGAISYSNTHGNIVGNNSAGGLVAYTHTRSITDCYSSAKVLATQIAGGLVAQGTNIHIFNSYSTGDIVASFHSGGIAGSIGGFSEFNNCYSQGTISGTTHVGGIVGYDGHNAPTPYENCYVLGDSKDLTGIFVGGKGSLATPVISNSYHIANYNNYNKTYSDEAFWNNISVCSSAEPYKYSNYDINDTLPVDKIVDFNLGGSQISFVSSISSLDFNNLKSISLTDSSYLDIINSSLNNIANKITEYSSVQNRLESALDEISIKYENLASSRSTIRDADMAKVSSQYIQQQILQDASATLLSSTQNIQYQNVLGLLQSLSG